MTASEFMNSDLLKLAESLAWRDEPETRRLYGKLSFYADNRRWVMSGLPPYLALRLKQMFPRINKAQAGVLGFPDHDETRTDLLWFMDRYPLTVSPEDLARLHEGQARFEFTRDDVERILSPDWKAPKTFPNFRPDVELRDNQPRAIEIAQKLGRLLIADDVGLGKSVSGLGCLMRPDFLPAIIVTEGANAYQWRDEAIKDFTTLKGHVIEVTKPYALPEADIYIFRWTNIFGWVDIFATGRFRGVVFDEVQQFRKGDDTQKGKAARVLADNAALRIGLSATPVYNYGTEAWHIIDLIERGALGTYEEFDREWCTYSGAKRVVKDPAAFGTYLLERNLMIRARGNAPPPNTIVHHVDYDQKVVDDAEGLAIALAQKVVSGSFTERGQAARELDMFARRITGLAKAKTVAAFVKLLLRQKAPVLLAGWHREVYDIWLTELAEFNPVMYTGSESPRQKNEAKASFMAGETDLFIISLRSGVGLDGLQHRCNTVVHGELDWSPKVHEQVRGRLRPHSKNFPIDEFYLVSDNGSDPVLIETLGLKESQSHGILNPLLARPQRFTDESRIKVLAENYLRGRS